MKHPCALASCVLLLAACGGTTTAARPGEGGDAAVVDTGPRDERGLPCDVDAVLDRSCRSCHGTTPQFGAPMSLVTYGDLVAKLPSDPKQTVFDAIARRMKDDAKPMPPAPNARVVAEDRAKIDAWLGSGAQPSTAKCQKGVPVEPKPLSCTPDQHVAPVGSWTMPTDRDDQYVCYGFDVTVTGGKRHVIGIAPHVDNSKIIHHALLFQTDRAISRKPYACAPYASVDWRMMYGWAPGTPSFELPAAAGFPEEGTTHYAVQLHYNNITHLEGEKDATGFDLCTTNDLRPNDADVLAFGTRSFSVPAKGKLDLSCTVPFGSKLPSIHVFGSFPHMHKIGRSISTTLYRAKGGPPLDLGSVPSWDFGNQTWFPLQDTLIEAGDGVETRCVWENASSAPVTYGEYTEDEMCFTFAMYYPRIKEEYWSWLVPAQFSLCAPN